MLHSFKRVSLVSQVAETIRTELQRGTWPDWIPSERELSELLDVSRNTCRSALHVLRCEGLVKPAPGRGNRVNCVASADSSRPSDCATSVGIIIPNELYVLRPQHTFMLKELQTKLYNLNIRLEVHSSPACYGKKPDLVLTKLVKKNPHACWILLLAHLPLQSWFMNRKIPCVVSGSNYPGILLHSVDHDLRAVCRHAAGTLISHGHRRVIFFNRRWRAAGDLQSELGFNEGIANSSHDNIEGRIVYHSETLASISLLVKQLFKVPACAPTAIIVANSFCYLSVLTTLSRSGLQVPQDVSLISRDYDSFFDYISPLPACYITNPRNISRKIISIIRTILAGEPARRGVICSQIMPRFLVGGSIRKL